MKINVWLTEDRSAKHLQHDGLNSGLYFVSLLFTGCLGRESWVTWCTTWSQASTGWQASATEVVELHLLWSRSCRKPGEEASLCLSLILLTCSVCWLPNLRELAFYWRMHLLQLCCQRPYSNSKVGLHCHDVMTPVFHTPFVHKWFNI